MTPSEWRDEDPGGVGLASDVCGLLANYIANVVPKGAVEGPDASVDVEFLIALVGWESDPSEESTTRLRVAFFDEMDAWRKVAQGQRFRRQGAQ